MAQTREKTTSVGVRGYPVRIDRDYDAETHIWVQSVGPDIVRLGLDPLGVEINGTLAQLSLAAPGERVESGGAFGQLEAAKFVGPLVCPVSGVVLAVNEQALASPAMVEREPYDAGWLVEIVLDAPLGSFRLVRGRDAIVAWFARKVEDYRTQGVLAE